MDTLTAPPPVWYVYLLRCSDDSLYTGITTDLEKRLRTHNSGRGSAYVRTRRPALLFAFFPTGGKVAAAKLEYHVKSLTRAQKLALARKWRKSGP